MNMEASRFAWLRFLLAAPFAAIALIIFGWYFTGLNHWGMRKGPQKYVWGLLFGTPMALANMTWNLIFATFVFWKLPPFKDDEGKFSVFFTTRIKKYRKEGTDIDMANLYAKLVRDWDPGHFS